jgi:hypothetical protein
VLIRAVTLLPLLHVAELATAVSACLCHTFGAQHVQQLGHGSVRRLLHLCASAAAGVVSLTGSSSSSSLSCVWGVHALAASAPAADNATKQLEAGQLTELGADSGPAGEAVNAVGLAGSFSRDDALRCLAAAPQLAELHSWSSWQQVGLVWHLARCVAVVCCSLPGCSMYWKAARLTAFTAISTLYLQRYAASFPLVMTIPPGYV